MQPAGLSANVVCDKHPRDGRLIEDTPACQTARRPSKPHTRDSDNDNDSRLWPCQVLWESGTMPSAESTSVSRPTGHQRRVALLMIQSFIFQACLPVVTSGLLALYLVCTEIVFMELKSCNPLPPPPPS